jgi:1-acylglycerone phosphate reductase
MKSVLVTGCSDGGIGSALALAFAQRGLLVFASARNTAKMSALANLPNIRLLTLDITNPEDVRAATTAVKKETGGSLDYLVNNAGQTRYMPLLDEDPDFEQAKELFELNVWSQLRMVQAFAPLLIEAKGTVVYISAVSARLNFTWIGTQQNAQSTQQRKNVG